MGTQTPLRARFGLDNQSNVLRGIGTESSISAASAGADALRISGGVLQISNGTTWENVGGSGGSLRVVTLTDAATVTPNADTTDLGILTSLSQPSTFANPTGTPTNGQLLQIRITSSASRAIAFGTAYQTASSLALPTATTGGGAEDYIAFRWNSTDSKWDLIGTTIGAYPTAIPSGTNTQVQFNDGGAFGADAGLTYNKTTDALSVTGSVIVPIVAAASSGNVNLILSPIGTGAIQLQVADNTATGGNARGQYSVDLQTVRVAATQVVSGSYSFAAGANNTVSAGSAVAIGTGNSVSGNGAFAAGVENTASGAQSTALGGRALARINQQVAMGARIFDPGVGKSQYNIFIAGATTTNATPTVLTSLDAAQITLQNNSAMRFNILVIANVTGGGNTSGWELKGVIKRGANAASTALVGTVTTTLVGQNAGASGWAIAATANTSTGGLTITATGQAGTTIRWVATVECAEVAF